MKDIQGGKNKKGINPLVVGAAGVAVGAGIAAALNDKKTKEKIGKVMGNIRSKVVDYMEKEKFESKLKNKADEVKKVLKTETKKNLARN